MRTIEELSHAECRQIAELKKLAVEVGDERSCIAIFPSGNGINVWLTRDDIGRIKQFICGVIEYRIKEVAK